MKTHLVVSSLFAAAVAVAACSEPPVGALVVEQPVADGGGEPSTDPDAGEAGADVDANVPVSFARDIRPLMNRGDTGPYGCKRCHYRDGADPQGLELGGLDLTTLGDLRKGGVSSKRGIVLAGDPDGSAIVQKLEGTYFRGARMPKDRTPWSVAEIALVRRWIAEGAKGADSE